MGAHLKFKLVEPDHAQLANQFIADQPEADRLDELGAQPIYFSEEQTNFDDVGEGQVKASAGVNSHADVPTLWASLFEKLHDHDDLTVKVLASSCALRLMTFTLEELNQVTNNGAAVSGPQADSYQRMIEKANAVESFPSPFVEKAVESDEEVSVALDKEQFILLDVFLTFHTETFRLDMLVDHIPLTEQEIALPVTELVNDGYLTTSSNIFYRLNRESEMVQELSRIHENTICPDLNTEHASPL